MVMQLETGIETAKVRAEQQRKEMESLEAQLRDSSVGKEDSVSSCQTLKLSHEYY